MIDYPNLVPECNVDTAFVEAIGYRRPNHAANINQVSLILQKQARKKVIGFIDNDKKMPSYFLEFNLVNEINDVALLKHNERDHCLVVVKPAMDEFIFNLSRNLEIDLSKYRLPTTLKAFIKETKKHSIKNHNGFRQLLNTIIQKNPPEIRAIKAWISRYSGL